MQYTAVLTSGPESGSLISVSLVATSDDGSAVIDTAHDYFQYVLEQLYGTDQGDDLMTWVAARGPEFGQIRARGTWLQSSGTGETERVLTILP